MADSMMLAMAQAYDAELHRRRLHRNWRCHRLFEETPM